MFGILSAFIETALMVLDPAYKTYKELKTLYSKDAITDDGKSPGHSKDPGNVDGPGHGQEPLGSSEIPGNTKFGEGSGDVDRSEERRRLLTHWIVFAAYRAVDFVVRPWLPMYSLINIAVVVWLRSGGSTIVYRSVIEPFLTEHEPTVDAWLARFDEAKDKMSDATLVLSTAASAAIANIDTDTNTNTKTNTQVT